MNAHRRKLEANVGKLIADRRKKLGFTSSKEFAESNDIDWHTLAQIEAGYDFRMSTFLRLCRKLKIKPETILKLINK